jgi:hypothetical protein
MLRLIQEIVNRSERGKTFEEETRLPMVINIANIEKLENNLHSAITHQR